MLVTSSPPQSLIATMRAAVEDCDDMSSEGSLMLLSPPHDVPEATLPAGTTSTESTTCDAVSPVVMTRQITPANRPLQYLEAGRLGASDPQHVLSRPSVPDLCITSSKPPVGHRSAATRPAISTHGCSHLFLAVDGSPPHTGHRQLRHPRRPSELSGITAIRGRPCRPYHQLCLGWQRRDSIYVGGDVPPSGGGRPGSPRRSW